MLVDLAPGCSVEVDRGPNWLFVRLPRTGIAEQDDHGLADRVWSLLEQAFTHRLVLEMDEVSTLPSLMIAELMQLRSRIVEQGGVMRIAGMSDCNQDVLRECHLSHTFPQYRDREEAVMGSRPANPR